MKNIAVAFWCEFIKMFRSKVPWSSLIAFLIFPITG